MSSIGGGSWSARLGADPFDLAGGSAAAINDRETYIARAKSFIFGLSNPAVIWEDFAQFVRPPGGWIMDNAGSGDVSASVAMSSAGLLSTGITTGSRSRLAAGVGGNTPGLLNVNAANASPWYFAARFALPNGTVSATGIRAFGLSDTGFTTSLLAGAFGANSTTRLQIQYNGNEAGSFLDVGAIDANVHVLEVYGPADGTLRARLDAGPELAVSGLNANPGPCIAELLCKNGAGTANEQLRLDWFLAMAQRS